MTDKIYTNEIKIDEELPVSPSGGLSSLNELRQRFDVGTTGYIRGGQTAYNTGIGFFLGHSTDTYKFSIGDPNSAYLCWNGSNAIIDGLWLVVSDWRLVKDDEFDFWLESYITSNAGANLNFLKTRGTQASKSIVASGDKISSIQSYGYDGVINREATRIESVVDGTPGSGDMPGRLSFYTTLDGAATPTERVRIANDGGLYAYNLLQQTAAGLVVEYDTTTKELYAETSAKKMKTNIKKANIDTSGLLELELKSWKDKASGKEELGLIADEVAKVCPEVVVFNEKGEALGIKYTKLSIFLLNELKKIKEELRT